MDCGLTIDILQICVILLGNLCRYVFLIWQSNECFKQQQQTCGAYVSSVCKNYFLQASYVQNELESK